MDGRVTFQPRQGVLKQLRARVRTIAAHLGASLTVCDNLALVVDEIVNNAIEHGSSYRHQNLDLAIEIWRVGDRIAVEFFDQEMPATSVQELARALNAAAQGTPSLESERGRGLFLMSIYLEGVRAEVAQMGGLRLMGLVAAQ